MPTVVQPQIFRVDDPVNYQQIGQGIGQGGGMLLAALLNYYRRKGGGAYTSPTGATTQVSPAEQALGGGPNLSQQLAQQATLGQGTFQPRRLPSFGQVPVSPQVLPQLQLQQAQADVAKAPLERRKLEAETKQTEAGAKLLERFGGGFGAIGEGGLPGAIVAVDDSGTPVSPDDPTATRKFLLQPSGAGGLPKLTPLTETAGERKDVERQSKAAELLEDTKLIMEDIENLFSFLDDVPAGRVAGSLAEVEKVFGTDSPAALGLRDYEAEKEAFIAKIQKTLGGEVGVLTDRDIDRIVRMMPKFYFTAEERRRRIESVKGYIQRRVESFTRRAGKQPAAQGEDFSQYTDEELQAIATGR